VGVLTALALFACGPEGGEPGGTAAVTIDSSMAVLPITDQILAGYLESTVAKVTSLSSGTAAGFAAFCAGEVDLLAASRPPQPAEGFACGKRGVKFMELPIAHDGISILVSAQNTWVDHLTLLELRQIWSPGSERILTWWSEVRDSFPETKLKLFGHKDDSGTFALFTKRINGKIGSTRKDYEVVTTQGALAHGVANDPGALGYGGFAATSVQDAMLRAVPIKEENDAEPRVPSIETIGNGTYGRLSRPLFLYVSKAAAERAEVDAFVRYWMRKGATAAKDAGYAPLTTTEARAAFDRYMSRRTGVAD
jgi:phosphate transport system substrate-binding protein